MHDGGVHESAVRFGPRDALVGVLTAPARTPDGARRALLLSNVGTNHHVGPFRVWVALARALAADGWYVFRYDSAGLGDSPARASAGGEGDANGADELREAMRWLTAHVGAAEFAVVALCSGVDAAHAVAATDPRVVAAAFIDGYTYRTAGWRVRRFVLRYLDAGRWRRYAARRAHRLRSGTRSRAEMSEDSSPVFDRAYPPLARFRADVAAMAARGARAHFIYTGTVDHAYNAAGQLYEALGAGVDRRAVTVELHRGADHVFSSVQDRAALIASLRRFLA